MKQANITLMLTKDHHVFKSGITPIEACLLTSMHHKNVGGNPIIVDEKSITDTMKEVSEEYTVDEDYIDPGPPKVIKTHKVTRTKMKLVPDNRSEDDEVTRLRGRYNEQKIDALLLKVRNFPKDFKEAEQKGVNIVLPTSSLSSMSM